MNNFYSYLISINIIAFTLYGLDKYFAIHDKWRISEKNLILVSVLGGSIGAYLAMQLFRHKTKHKKFTIGIPLIFVLEAIAILIFKDIIFK